MWNKDKKEKQTDAASIVTKESIGFTLAAFSILVLLMSFTGSALFGELGTSVTSFLFGLFGFMAYPVFIGLLYFSVTLVTGKNFIPTKGMTVSGFGAVALVGLLVHTILTASYPHESYGEYLSACFEAGNGGAFASTPFGAAGGLITYPITAIATSTGAYIIFAAGICLCGYILINSVLIYSGIRLKPRKQKEEKSENGQASSASQAQPVTFEELDNSRTPQTAEGYGYTPYYNSAPVYPEQPIYRDERGQMPEYQSQNGYAPQNGYGQQNSYETQNGYGQQGTYTPQNGYYEQQNSYETQNNYGQQNTYAPQNGYGTQDIYHSQNSYTPQNRYSAQDVYNTQRPSGNVVFDKTTPSPYSRQNTTAYDYNARNNANTRSEGAAQGWNGAEDGNAIRNALYGSNDVASDYRKKNLIFDSSSSFHNRSRTAPSTPARSSNPANTAATSKSTSTTSVSSASQQAETGKTAGSSYTESSYSQMYSKELDGRNTVSEQPRQIVQEETPAVRGGYSMYKTDVYDTYMQDSDSAELTVRPTYKAPEPAKPAVAPVTPEEPVKLAEPVEPTTPQKATPAVGSTTPVATSRTVDEPMSLRDRFNADRARQRNERISEEAPTRESESTAPSEREAPITDRKSLFDDDKITIGELTEDYDVPDFRKDEARGVLSERSREGLSSAMRESRRSPADSISTSERNGEKLTPPVRESSASEPPTRGEAVPDRTASVQPKGQASESSAPPKPRVIKDYVRPSLDLFDSYSDSVSVNMDEIEANKQGIVETLAGFNIAADVVRVTTGPAFTRYEITIPKNVMAKNVARYADNIAMSLHAESNVNIYSNFTQGTVAIEVPNRKRSVVGMRNMLQSEAYINAKPGSLMFCIGKDVEGKSVCGSLSKMPHILVAGATGSGKSVFLNELIISLIMKYSPEEVRLILIDPKQIEFAPYDQLPHLMINEIIADVQKAIVTLNWVINEMEHRYTLFKQLTTAGTTVRNIDEYNAAMSQRADKLPKLVIIVDELADLMSVAKKDIEDRISRIAAKARAAGIHLVLATQRPSVDVVTGVLKANLPSRFAFRVSSDTDSRVILDEMGAENLLGAGDLLYKTGSMFGLERVQGAWLDSSEIQRVCDFIRQNNEAYYDENVSNFINSDGKSSQPDGEDEEGESEVEPVYIDALRFVVQSGSASISMIQRKCSVGYNKAGKIIEWMELSGYISPFEGAKSRKVLLSADDFRAKYGEL